MPPPPTAMITNPFSTEFFMASLSIISIGIGEGTTLIYPLPESLMIVQPFSFLNAGSILSTLTWVTIVTAFLLISFF